MKKGCSTLECSATGVDIGFDSKLFGLDDDESGVEFGVGEDTSNQAFPTWSAEKGQWVLNCALGECGMAHRIENDE